MGENEEGAAAPQGGEPATRAATDEPTSLNLPEQPNVDRSPNLFELPASIGDTRTPDFLLETPYDQNKARDHTRETVTLWLIGLFCAIVALAFAALYARGVHNNFGDKFFDELKSLLDVLVGPVITLLSSAVGFYFGYQQGSGNNTTPQRTP